MWLKDDVLQISDLVFPFATRCPIHQVTLKSSFEMQYISHIQIPSLIFTTLPISIPNLGQCVWS